MFLERILVSAILVEAVSFLGQVLPHIRLIVQNVRGCLHLVFYARIQFHIRAYRRGKCLASVFLARGQLVVFESVFVGLQFVVEVSPF